MDDPHAYPAKKTTFGKKILSGANWGMLAGFWVELPMLVAFLFKPLRPKTPLEWFKVSEWSVKIVLPATLTGLVYGYTKPERDAAKVQAALNAPPAASGAAGAGDIPRRNWVKAVQSAAQPSEENHLQL